MFELCFLFKWSAVAWIHASEGEEGAGTMTYVATDTPPPGTVMGFLGRKKHTTNPLKRLSKLATHPPPREGLQMPKSPKYKRQC